MEMRTRDGSVVKELERTLNGKWKDGGYPSFKFRAGPEIDCEIGDGFIHFPEYSTYIHDDSGIGEAIENLIETVARVMLDWPEEGLEIARGMDEGNVPNLLRALRGR